MPIHRPFEAEGLISRGVSNINSSRLSAAGGPCRTCSMQVKENRMSCSAREWEIEPKRIPEPCGERRLRDTREGWRSPSPELAFSCITPTISSFSEILLPHLLMIVHILL